ncbi:uncharacterized protein CANTADRAFT_3527 [Suhomyces tanzawaensis NRRL Y-17324]|uniref:Uncharacterized protein n=1 Tax=Suhomyces tanzawaensis NRRL Y-17324 TaxID=984487 RepID=A0A1E4SPJ4_9ASCO|nr:uncharacterized protein CANTADRAFT_3527 [Suhomyces tanzawaensis NRRL Y-17324]ODV81415.1 hypothetical protein CANTADRAFT_3527 [Suhomyces tanzawaensis NRRL Y-17324]
MKFSSALTTSAFASMAMAGAISNSTVVVTHVTVTGYTTYCPEPTQVVITKCAEHVCAPTTITVTEAKTVIVEEPCLVPATYTSHVAAPTTDAPAVAPPATSSAVKTNAAEVHTWDNGASMNVAGVAAFVGVALALV